MNSRLTMAAVVDSNNKFVTDEKILQDINYGFPIIQNHMPNNRMLIGKTFYGLLNTQQTFNVNDIETYVFTRSNDIKRTIPEINSDMMINHQNDIIYGSTTVLELAGSYIRDMYLIHLIDTNSGDSAKDLPLNLQLDKPFIQEKWFNQELETNTYNGYKYVVVKYSCFDMTAPLEEKNT